MPVRTGDEAMINRKGMRPPIVAALLFGLTLTTLGVPLQR